MSKSISAKELKKFSKYHLGLKIKSITHIKHEKGLSDTDNRREKWILKKLKKKYIIKKIR